MPASKDFLKLHRSSRFVPLNPGWMVATCALAAAISAGIAWQHVVLVQIHENLREKILGWTGVPVIGHAVIASFSGENIRIAISPVANYTGRPQILGAI